jgi:hypothetical protein
MNDDQPDMFGHNRAFARRSDPDTSHEAAAVVTPTLRKLQAEVLAFAASCGPQGFTDPELAEHFDCQGSTYRTRRSELVTMGLVMDSGQRRASPAKRKFAVWRITERGKVAHANILIAGLDRAA